MKEGAVFIVSCGAYSDYQSLMVCRALVDFDEAKVMSEFLAAEWTGKSPDVRKFNEYMFCAWLVNRTGYAVEVEGAVEWNIGYYDEPDESGQVEVVHHPSIGKEDAF